MKKLPLNLVLNNALGLITANDNLDDELPFQIYLHTACARLAQALILRKTKLITVFADTFFPAKLKIKFSYLLKEFRAMVFSLQVGQGKIT